MLDLYFSYVQTFGLPPRNYLLVYLLAVAFARVMRRGAIPVPRSAYRLLIPTTLLVVWAVVLRLSVGDRVADALYDVGSGLGAAVAIGILTVCLLEDGRDVRAFVHCVAVFLTLSSAVALLQFVGVEAAWRVREMLGVDADSAIAWQILQRERPPGLTYFSIQLSYQLITLFPILGSVWLARATTSATRRLYGLACVMMALALVATLTRSAIAGAVVGLGAVIMLSAPRRRLWWLVVTTVACVALVSAVDLGSRRGLSWEALAYGRLALYVTALRVAVDNPLGVGAHSRFSEYAANYYSEVVDLPGAHVVLGRAAHSQFLNVLLALGVPGLLGFLWFYRELFRLAMRLRRSMALDTYLQAVSSGLVGAFVGYVVNSFFHNAGPFSGDPFHWYWVGLVLVIARAAERRGDPAGG